MSSFVPRIVHGTEIVSRDRRFDAPLPHTRPGDRVDPWPVRDEAALRPLAAAARSRCLPTETSAVLVIERALLDDDDLLMRAAGTPTALDAAAAAARVTIALSEPQSAYLATLRGACTGRDSSLPRLIPIPMRLTERIGDGGVERLLRAELLDSALAWEQAAVLAGRTMAEWAMRAALAHGVPPVSASA
jgi:hypothetical protein